MYIVIFPHETIKKIRNNILLSIEQKGKKSYYDSLHTTLNKFLKSSDYYVTQIKKIEVIKVSEEVDEYTFYIKKKDVNRNVFDIDWLYKICDLGRTVLEFKLSLNSEKPFIFVYPNEVIDRTFLSDLLDFLEYNDFLYEKNLKKLSIEGLNTGLQYNKNIFVM